MKVTYADVPLGNGLIDVNLSEGGWSLAVHPTVPGCPTVLIQGESLYEFRRFLARITAAVDISDLADVESQVIPLPQDR